VLLLTAPAVLCPGIRVPFAAAPAVASVPLCATIADVQDEYAEAEADAKADEREVMFAEGPAEAVADVHAPEE